MGTVETILAQLDKISENIDALQSRLAWFEQAHIMERLPIVANYEMDFVLPSGDILKPRLRVRTREEGILLEILTFDGVVWSDRINYRE